MVVVNITDINQPRCNTSRHSVSVGIFLPNSQGGFSYIYYMKNIINHQPIVGVMRWGAWGSQFSTEQYEEIIYQCLSIGLNEFDHADIYGHYTTEAEFGKALQNNSSLRTQIKLITKCGIQMLTPNRLAHQIKSYNTSAGTYKGKCGSVFKKLSYRLFRYFINSST
jgi:hypothetical protein